MGFKESLDRIRTNLGYEKKPESRPNSETLAGFFESLNLDKIIKDQNPDKQEVEQARQAIYQRMMGIKSTVEQQMGGADKPSYPDEYHRLEEAYDQVNAIYMKLIANKNLSGRA